MYNLNHQHVATFVNTVYKSEFNFMTFSHVICYNDCVEMHKQRKWLLYDSEEQKMCVDTKFVI